MSLARLSSALLVVLFVAVAAPAHAQQTIVLLRHGEKPSAGLGQLTCQGLNRSLALPDVLLAKFGKPTSSIQYGGGVTVPAWTSGDYDTLYVVTVNYTTNGITAQFHRDFEGLNNQPTSCP